MTISGLTQIIEQQALTGKFRHHFTVTAPLKPGRLLCHIKRLQYAKLDSQLKGGKHSDKVG